MKKLFFAVVLIATSQANAACRIVYVDHDFNALTPVVKKQVCESQLDLPAINNPGLRPIQTPALKPLEPLTLPPLGTTRCRTQRVWDGYRWVNQRLCQ